jgi:ATP-dependent DNA helicase RecQ
VRINTFLVKNSQDEEEVKDQTLVEHNLGLLKEMTFYATTSDCLRSRLLAYFGEAGPAYCGNCSNCNTVFEETDVTIPARKIISCVYRLKERGRSFGKTMVINILRGAKSEKIRASHSDTLSTYGIMTDMDSHRIRLVLDHLIAEGYLGLEGEEYPVLVLRPKYREAFDEEKTVRMMLPSRRMAAFNPSQSANDPEGRMLPSRRMAVPFQSANDPKGRMLPEDAAGGGNTRTAVLERSKTVREHTADSGEPAARDDGAVPSDGAARSGGLEEALFARLKELRTRLAREAGVPAYVVFSDAALRDMCRRRPRNAKEFLGVNGVGAVKLEKYGDAFMAVIRECEEEFPA